MDCVHIKTTQITGDIEEDVSESHIESVEYVKTRRNIWVYSCTCLHLEYPLAC